MPDSSTTHQEHRAEALIVGLRPIVSEQVVEIGSGRMANGAGVICPQAATLRRELDA